MSVANCNEVDEFDRQINDQNACRPLMPPVEKPSSNDKSNLGEITLDCHTLNPSTSPVLENVNSDSPGIRAYASLLILFVVNLLNYMDRLTIAGVLSDVQKHFSIRDAHAGLLQTVFVCSFMIFAPPFGYLGDRYSRKLIMIVGLLVWTGAVLLSSFVSGERFILFVLLRGVVGIGEASYTTVAPTLIADLFPEGDLRSRALMLFYFAIPIGSGLGFVVGSNVALAMGSWQWGLRVTPMFGIVCVILIAVIINDTRVPFKHRYNGSQKKNTFSEQSNDKNNKNNKRNSDDSIVTSLNYDPAVNADIPPLTLNRFGCGICDSICKTNSSGTNCLSSKCHGTRCVTWLYDLRCIISCRTYVWSTLGFTCVTFATGALGWWGPSIVMKGTQLHTVHIDSARINLIFGAITLLSGFIGVIVGASVAQLWRRRNPRADPLVCAIGMLVAVPFLFGNLVFLEYNVAIAWGIYFSFVIIFQPFMFVGVTFLSLNWSIISDIMLYITAPPRRATASAFQILVSHLLGDASSPYIIGLVSQFLQGSDYSYHDEFLSLQRALFICLFVCVLGGFFFFAAAWYIQQDRRIAHDFAREGSGCAFDGPTAASDPPQLTTSETKFTTNQSIKA